jgi:FAD/FMN-containing dehydrogenase
MINRREFASSLLKVMAGSVVATPSILKSLQAQTGLPVSDLRKSLRASDGLIVVPGDAGFAGYQIAFNKRTMLTPEIRVLCKSAKGIATVVRWARENRVGFATRGGGHCYEGFSQSLNLVIDTRLVTDFRWEGDSAFSVGSGARLGFVYENLSARGRAIPAGSCPTVCIAGHSLGGGYGFLARPLGLACDSFASVEIITADGKIVTASDSENADLFWAIKGGGGGSFGVVSRFALRSHRVGRVAIYSANWVLPIDKAARVFDAWQEWAPNAPSGITSTMSVSKSTSGAIKLHSGGQSTGSETDLREQLRSWTSKVSPSVPLRSHRTPTIPRST